MSETTDGLVAVRFLTPGGDALMAVRPFGDIVSTEFAYKLGQAAVLLKAVTVGGELVGRPGDPVTLLGLAPGRGKLKARITPSGETEDGEPLPCIEVALPAAVVDTLTARRLREMQLEEEDSARARLLCEAAAEITSLAAWFEEVARAVVRPEEVVRSVLDEHTAPQSIGVAPWLRLPPAGSVPHAGIAASVARYEADAADREGAAGAWYLYGVRCWAGLAMARDEEGALSWLQKAADAGHVRAVNMLGVFYLERGDREGAYGLFQSAAGAGSVAAKHNLAATAAAAAGGGGAAATAAGGRAELRSLWLAAAEAGHPAAMVRLAELIPTGDSGPAAERALWLGRAAAAGIPHAQRMLAECLCTGSGVPRSARRAEALYRVVAARGDPDAQYALACCLLGTWAAEGPPPSGLRQASQFVRKDVLVIASNYASRRLTGQMLRKAGWNADEAPDGRTAARMSREARARGEPYTVMVIEIDPPPSGNLAAAAGLEALRVVRRQEILASAAVVPAVACCADAGVGTAVARGVAAVLEKPVGPRALTNACFRAAARADDQTTAAVDELLWPSPSRHRAGSPHRSARAVDAVLRWNARAREYGALPASGEERTAEAEKWLRAAAAQGHAEAANALGFVLINGGAQGEVTPARLEEGAHWYRVAAEAGLESAKHNLRVCVDSSAVGGAAVGDADALAFWWAFGQRWRPPLTEDREGSGDESSEEDEVSRRSPLLRIDHFPEGNSPTTAGECPSDMPEAAGSIATTEQVTSAEQSPACSTASPGSPAAVPKAWETGDRVRVLGTRRALEAACNRCPAPYSPRQRKELAARGGAVAVVLATDLIDRTVKLLFSDGGILWAPGGAVVPEDPARAPLDDMLLERRAAREAEDAVLSIDHTLRAAGFAPDESGPMSNLSEPSVIDLLKIVVTDVVATGLRRERDSAAGSASALPDPAAPDECCTQPASRSAEQAALRRRSTSRSPSPRKGSSTRLLSDRWSSPLLKRANSRRASAASLQQLAAALRADRADFEATTGPQRRPSSPRLTVSR